jgi:hypothetical protein
VSAVLEARGRGIGVGADLELTDRPACRTSRDENDLLLGAVGQREAHLHLVPGGGQRRAELDGQRRRRTTAGGRHRDVRRSRGDAGELHAEDGALLAQRHRVGGSW